MKAKSDAETGYGSIAGGLFACTGDALVGRSGRGRGGCANLRWGRGVSCRWLCIRGSWCLLAQAISATGGCLDRLCDWIPTYHLLRFFVRGRFGSRASLESYSGIFLACCHSYYYCSRYVLLHTGELSCQWCCGSHVCLRVWP